MDHFFTQDLRIAARRADRSCDCPAGHDSARALEVWDAVLDGSCSLVEWFDTETRRLVVVRANPPGVRDPRRFSKHERAVVRHAALGEANKLIAHRLGVSQTRVSFLLSAAIRKLDLRTKAQLVYWVRGLDLPVRDGGPEAHFPALLKSG